VKSALLVIDVINDFDFPGGDELLAESRRTAPALAGLLAAARQAGEPVIYANDNLGRWHADFRRVCEHCGRPEAKGADFVRGLLPAGSDYFILKPKHSAFYASSLEPLLQHLEVRRLWLAGIAGDGCVLCTAADAHMRDYRVSVVADCTASITPERNRRALEHLRVALGQELLSAAALRQAWAEGGAGAAA